MGRGAYSIRSKSGLFERRGGADIWSAGHDRKLPGHRLRAVFL